MVAPSVPLQKKFPANAAMEIARTAQFADIHDFRANEYIAVWVAIRTEEGDDARIEDQHEGVVFARYKPLPEATPRVLFKIPEICVHLEKSKNSTVP